MTGRPNNLILEFPFTAKKPLGLYIRRIKGGRMAAYYVNLARLRG